MIDVNEKMHLIADATIKLELISQLETLFKDFGQTANTEEVIYISNRLFQEINRKYREMHWGVMTKAFEMVLVGKVSAAKITVHNLLIAIHKQADLWTEVKTRNNHETIEKREKELKNKNISNANSPIVMAAVWLIGKRCDKIDVGDIEVRDVAECIERGINPETLLKNEAKGLV